MLYHQNGILRIISIVKNVFYPYFFHVNFLTKLNTYQNISVTKNYVIHEKNSVTSSLESIEQQTHNHS